MEFIYSCQNPNAVSESTKYYESTMPIVSTKKSHYTRHVNIYLLTYFNLLTYLLTYLQVLADVGDLLLLLAHEYRRNEGMSES